MLIIEFAGKIIFINIKKPSDINIKFYIERSYNFKIIMKDVP